MCANLPSSGAPPQAFNNSAASRCAVGEEFPWWRTLSEFTCSGHRWTRGFRDALNGTAGFNNRLQSENPFLLRTHWSEAQVQRDVPCPNLDSRRVFRSSHGWRKAVFYSRAAASCQPLRPNCPIPSRWSKCVLDNQFRTNMSTRKGSEHAVRCQLAR